MAQKAAYPSHQIGRMRLASGLLIGCGALLCFDIGGEIHAFTAYPQSVSLAAMAHLVAETVATFGVGLAFLINQAALRRSVREAAEVKDCLSALRDDFDRHMHKRFSGWGLSPAETDVALLTVRGLKIAEIAKIRGAQIGTIKSQLSMIFKKSGASTRTEFVARFVDDFLELTTSKPTDRGPGSQAFAGADGH